VGGVNALATAFEYGAIMSDSLERLYRAIIAARDLDPAASRTARLLERGPSKMAKKLAEEAIEVVIDAVNGNRDAVVRESADLLYNLAVLWAGARVRPQDVWAEMDRRERMQGIAEKLPKSAANKNSSQSPALVPKDAAAPRASRRPIVAHQGGRAGKRRKSFLQFIWPRMDKSMQGWFIAPMLRRIYDWCIAAADKPYALWLMGAVSFAESSFFPIPPDVMLIPMSLARPQRAWMYALVCTVTSVAGGVVGYAIGALLYDSIGQWLIQLYGYGDKVEAFRASYAEYGAWIILLKGLTPIPYKIVTITSGFADYNLWLFVLFSIIARGGRFFIVAIVLNRYGTWIRKTIEQRLGLWVALGTGLLVIGFVIAFRLF
jgi:phosphoribosyl-ATP pyrophosphohydrolase